MMKEEFYNFICETLNKLLGTKEKYDVNSLLFIKLFVEIEDKYGFEFSDEYITLERLNTIDTIYTVTQKYVEKLK